MSIQNIDVLWDDNPVDITSEANFIWSIANKLRGVYMPDKYGDVIIPMTIIRRLECALEPTKKAVVAQFEKNPAYPEKAMYRLSGFQFYNTSNFTLKELCNDADHIEENFKAYIAGFSSNVQSLLNDEDTLNIGSHIKTMSKGGCLYTVVKAFSELDLSPETYDSIKMGYIFENLIGRFFQNVDAGQYYTGRDIIKMCVSLLIAEGCDDIFEDGKIITVCDQACGTGGMLSTAYSYLRHYNPTADVRLFGQEYNGVSHAIGLAEMLIKGQNAENFRHADTFKEDCFKGTKMRFVLENPPFGTPWAGKDAKEGQEQAVNDEYAKGFDGRWGAGLPSGGDAQLIFIQSAIDKMDDHNGRAAIIENGSPLFTGGTASAESQVRRWLLENDLIEAIVQMPTDLFYNTGISTYVWILSKNKRIERKGKIQLIDASGICHKLRKPLGNKKNEFSPEDRATITKLYADFEENELVKIYDNEEFIYREYAVMQPLQRSYSITDESISTMLQSGALKGLWDDAKVAMQGMKVLLIDADPQGDLTTCLGWQDTDNLGITLATKLTDVINETMNDPTVGILHHDEGVDLVPANLELSAMEFNLVNAMSRETALRNYLSEVKDKYDYILIDCMGRTYESMMEELEVIEILSTAYNGDEFPGYENIRLSFSQLETIIRNKRSGWLDALRNQKAVYLITDGTYHFSWTDANHKRRYVYAKTLDELRYKEEQIAKDKSDGIKAEDL